MHNATATTEILSYGASGLYLDYQVVDWFESYGFKLGVVDRRLAWFIETLG